MKDSLQHIPVAEPSIDERELENVIRAVKSGWISSMGSFIPEFEERFASYCGARYGVATCNGTAALHLALAALGIGEGDEVIVPSLTFVASANVVRYAMATPIFVDVTPDYWCMDPTRLEEKITGRTKAIMPVHLFGNPCDMDAINDIARRHGLDVIEDAAEAHGAEFRGTRVGSLGRVGCFSFYGNKAMTTGEGGMCVTDDADLAQTMRVLRDHGMDPSRRYWHEVTGFNYRMTNVQAAIGVAQLEKLDSFIQKKRRIAGWYREGLSELAKDGRVTLHAEMPWAKSIYWMYSIVLAEGSTSRDELASKLAADGIDTRPFFHPMHRLPMYENGERFPTSERLAANGLNLPSGVTLNREQADRITGVLASAI